MQQKIHPSLLERKIIHVDMDAFYASVEIRDNPDLLGKPVAVGGPAKSRGVVLTANYEARKFGVRSALSCYKASKLCKDLIFVRPRFEAYQEASDQIMEIFLKHTKFVQPLSLDEAYLDVTENPQGLYASKIANLIRQEIYDKTRLTASAGVAPNRMLAKIASDLRKPNGLTIILPDKVSDFMKALPLIKIPGVGPVTNQKLQEAGFNLCGDLWNFSHDELAAKYGSLGSWIFSRCRGIDESVVRDYYGPRRKRKSYGRETTFSEDIVDVEFLREKLKTISAKISKKLTSSKVVGRTITLKLKYDDFQRVTRSQTLNVPIQDEEIIFDVVSKLLLQTEAGRRKVRLIGLSISNVEPYESMDPVVEGG